MATQRVPDKKKNSNNNFLKLHRKYLVVMVSERIRRNEKKRMDSQIITKFLTNTMEFPVTSLGKMG